MRGSNDERYELHTELTLQLALELARILRWLLDFGKKIYIHIPALRTHRQVTQTLVAFLLRIRDALHSNPGRDAGYQ